jgi:hypothetical protein
MAEYKPWLYESAIRDAFDAHPKEFKESFKEVFPRETFTAFTIPSTVKPGERETLYFFVRAAGNPESSTPESKAWDWTEQEIDRQIKGILEEVLGLKLSDWIEKYY